ncbi:MAG: histidinol-phosphate transaminase [gamma proteobacterium symbiont of Taylorina sp.]|nr:histidinol-phosphate transaminase [gamma proteobacterium symbiont of Taylorina sp.]
MTGIMSSLPEPVAGVASLSPYIPGKPVEELEREYGVSHAVKLASNENPLGPSPEVIEHLTQLLGSPFSKEAAELSRYPDGNGFILKNKLLEKLSLDSVEQITLGNGSNDVLDILARTYAAQGDEVIFSQYGFAVYPIAAQAVGAKAIVTKAKNWGHDLNAMLEAISDKTTLIFIANPNNPTGTCLAAKDLHEFLQKVPLHIVVVIDEAYEEYASYTQSTSFKNYHSMLPDLKQFDNLVITRTFSKAYGLASFRIGYAVSSIAVADCLNRVRQPFNNNSLALEAAAIALDDQQHINQSVALNWQGMMFLTDAFKRLKLNYIPSAGNFICVEVGEKSAQIYEKLLYEAVIVRPLANYQMQQHLRISIGTMDENQRFLNALEKVLSI